MLRFQGLAPFSHPAFRRFFAARFLAGMAQQVHNVGLGWLVYDRTGSAMALGLVGLAAFAPALLLALASGHVADRFDRRLIVTVCWTVVALADATLALLSLQHDGPVWPVYAVAMLVGSARAFANPAGQALLPSLVPRDVFPGAVSLMASAWQSSSIIGPAIGGLLYILGPAMVFGSAAACFALSAAFVFSLGPRPGAGGGRPTLESLFAGIGFIRSRPVVLGAISLDLFAVLLGGATALLPIYARDILHTGPWGLGLLRSMPALGAVAMSVLLAWRPLQRGAGRKIITAVSVFGAATLVFGLSETLWLSMAALFVTGAAADPGAAGNAGRDARPGSGRQQRVHRRLQRARRVRIRGARRGSRPGRLCGAGRHRHARGGGGLGAAVPAAVAARPAGQLTRRRRNAVATLSRQRNLGLPEIPGWRDSRADPTLRRT